MRFTALHLFCGLGGGALGFQRAGFRSVGAIDYDAGCVADFHTLTGETATQADLATMSPAELRAACTGRPDVVFTSPPCQGNSASLPASRASEPHYLKLNSLAYRGVWLALEAWAEDPPGLFVLENVPRITARSRGWLDQLGAMLRGYGYAVRESFHDCGEIGGLAQRRRRFLLVARRLDTVTDLLREPPTVPLKGIGEVVTALGMPHQLPRGQAGQSLHYLPRMTGMNWVRLALVPAGGDWRDLPEQVRFEHGSVDPSGVPVTRSGPWGVRGWDEHAGCVIASQCHDNAASSVADPRLTNTTGRYHGACGVQEWREASGCVTATPNPVNNNSSIADPRVTCKRREGSMGVKDWGAPSTCIIGQGTHHNGPWQVADPRLEHKPRKGGHSVRSWAEPTHTIISEARVDKGFNVADPRVPTIVGNQPIDLKAQGYLVIRAADGTWHRPLTTAELGLLQGLPLLRDDGTLVELEGRSHGAWRRRIGNAVPPPSAEAIARECWATLEAAQDGGFRLSSNGIWVEPQHIGGAP